MNIKIILTSAISALFLMGFATMNHNTYSDQNASLDQNAYGQERGYGRNSGYLNQGTFGQGYLNQGTYGQNNGWNQDYTNQGFYGQNGGYINPNNQGFYGNTQWGNTGDFGLTQQIRGTLINDIQNVNITATQDGTVQLRGTVTNSDLKDAIVQTAKNIQGVKKVKDDIKVVRNK